MIYFGGNEIGSVKWGSLDVSKAYLGSQEVWSEGGGEQPGWFTMKNVGTGAQTLKMSNVGDNVEYSSDGGSTWTAYVNASDVTVGEGSEVMFRHNGVSAWTPSRVNVQGSTGLWNVSGNIMTLLDQTGEATSLSGMSYAFSGMFQDVGVVDASQLQLPQGFVDAWVYSSMFSRCTSLTSAPVVNFSGAGQGACSSMFAGCTSLSTPPELPATSLGTSVYVYMFRGCTNLTAAPELPATTLQNYCYSNMFAGCTSLSTPPVLSAMTLARGCYKEMLSGCVGLTAAPQLPATTLAQECYNSMFAGCTSLSTPPVLSATTLAQSCYSSMFSGCTNLSSAPVLPATTLAQECYNSMFAGCTSLSTPPVLSATTLAQSCYSSMFSGCTNLSSAPVLPATTLTSNCYNRMFYGCTSLTSAPELPAQTFAQQCYNSMFGECSNLTQAPYLPATTGDMRNCYQGMFRNCVSLTAVQSVLPATTLSIYCYNSMFEGCTALTTAPKLPATTLTSNCYNRMFRGCSNISAIECGLTSWNGDGTNNWLSGVAAAGTFICPTELGTDETIERGVSRCPEGWTVTEPPEPVDPTDGVEFKALGTGRQTTTFSIGKTNASAPDVSLQKSEDGGLTWSAYSLGDAVKVHGGSSVKFKAADGVVNGAFCYGAVEVEGEDLSCVHLSAGSGVGLSASGDMSLLIDSSATGAQARPYQFAGFFKGCDLIVDASGLKLPDTADYSFYEMFEGATQLSSAPDIKVSEARSYCCRRMFRGCSSLTSTPEISCGAIGGYAFQQAFTNCASLVQAKDVSCDGAVWGYAFHWAFANCTGLTSTPALPSNIQDSHVYEQAFIGCTGLQTASVSLQSYRNAACREMFFGCTSLSSLEIQAPADPTASGGNPYRCFYGLADGCSSLHKITVPFTKWDMEQQFTSYWLRGTASGLEFWCPKQLPSVGQTGGYNIRDTEHTIPGTAVVYDIEGNDPLMFTAGTGGAGVSLTKVGSAPDVSVSYSLDGDSWLQYDFSSTGEIPVSEGQSIRFKATSSNEKMCASSSIGHRFAFTGGDVSASGSLMSLLGPNIADVTAGNSLDRLFTNCGTLTDASQLQMPHRKLPSGAVSGLFQRAYSLTAAPELPSMEPGAYCYDATFHTCSALVKAPTVISCYNSANSMCRDMFGGCTSLSAPPSAVGSYDGAAAQQAFARMFQGCTSLSATPDFTSFNNAGASSFLNAFSQCTGLLDAAEMHISATAAQCLRDMYTDCTSLSGLNGLTLPAETVAPSAYSGMFLNCSALVETPVINASSLGANAMVRTFEGTKITNAAQVSATTLATQAFRGCYTNCTALTGAADLPAVLSQPAQYRLMYSGCTSLRTPPVIHLSSYGLSCCQQMFNGCTALTSAPELSGVAIYDFGCNGMFQDCSSLTDAPSMDSVSQVRQYACSNMFLSCAALTSAPPVLKATGTLPQYAYNNMFAGTSITRSPAISASNPGARGMQLMFSGCSALTCITTNLTAWSNNGTVNWVSGVAEAGDFYCPATLDVSVTSFSRVPAGWTVHDVATLTADSDEDGYTDGEEIAVGSDPEDPGSTPDDIDGDGFSNAVETQYGSDPRDVNSTPMGIDTDGDGYSDYEEQDAGTDSTDPASHPSEDDPYANDSDGDGYSDGDEQDAGTDPNDPDSHPEDEPDPEEEPEEEP